jgi:arylsulfatase A-like enzyme
MQPNFVFIIADQLRADHTGFGGNTIVRTPHLDALASRSVQFDQAFVANPICMPNRSSILTGRMPSVHGTRFNGIPLDKSAHTFVRELKSHGYQTAHIGKAHYQNLGDGPTNLVDEIFKTPGDAWSSPHPIGWDEYELHERHRRERVEMPPDFYGFEHTELVTHHSDLCAGHYYHWAKDKGFELDPLQGPGNALSSYADWAQVYQTAVPEEIYPTRFVAERTCDYLKSAGESSKPFILHTSFPDPHHPFTPPGRYYEMYDPADVPLPATFNDPHTDSMPHYQFMSSRRGKTPRMWVAAFAPSEDQFRHAAAAAYGMISMIDDAVGEILATLDATGLRDNTVVVFTSDHGDMFGDHGMILKGAMHYDGCVRVPLLIDAPGARQARTSSLACSIDLPHTLLGLAGVPEYHGMQGVSLEPLLSDPDAEVRDHVLIEEDEMFDMLFIGHPFRGRTLITPDARLSIYAHTEDGEMFDRHNDPTEMTNLFKKSGHEAQQAELTDLLARTLMDTADTSPKPTRMAWPLAIPSRLD